LGPLLIVGGGPSLNSQVDELCAWQGDVFCCNRFTLWRNPPVSPDYYSVSANAVIKDVEPRDPPYKERRFVISRRRDQLVDWDETWTTVYKKEWHDLLQPGAEELLVRGGCTMPGIMAQLAIWMGYTDIHFVGIEQRGAGHMYDPLAQMRVKYVLPSEEVLFENWKVLKRTYEAMGIRLRDATPDGRLNEILGYEPL
jgi:hypothetical protein